MFSQSNFILQYLSLLLKKGGKGWVLFLCLQNLQAQINFIPNPGFEEHGLLTGNDYFIPNINYWNGHTQYPHLLLHYRGRNGT